MESNAQEPTSIHQEQLDFYNNAAAPADANWYEENVNTTVYSSPETKSACNLESVVYGWHPYWVGSAYNNYDFDLLSHFSFFSYEVDENTGDPLTTHGWSTSGAVDAALASGNTKVTLCVTLFGGSDLTTFLTNATAKQTLIDNLITLVDDRGAHGVNIDFEGLPSSQKTNFANFMVDLSDQMHAAIPGSEVSTVLYAVDWNNVFDFSIMANAVDHFIVMGYAYYYQGSSTAGPCDPLYHFGSSYNYTLSRTTSYYLDKGCPREKFVVGLPYYGYEWSTSSQSIPSSTTASGTARTFAYVMNNSSGYYSAGNHIWDADSYTDIFVFNNGSNDRQCFIALEDAFRKRLEFVNHAGVAGIGIWALGYDDGYNHLWNAIEDYLTDCHEDPCTGQIHDFGGPTKDYYDDEDYTWTIAPTGATSIDIDFTMFDVELNYDTLWIYDGASTSDPLIGAYTGTNSPGTFTTSGGAVTFRFWSDGATNTPGFLADYACSVVISNPSADFSVPGSPALCQGETVQFINQSTNATNYYWEFENGIPATSTATDPVITYNSSGTFDVTLHAIDGIDTNTMVQTISVSVGTPPNSLFSSNSPVYLPNSTIYFSNASSNASSYNWDFGDGNVSTDANPWNQYASAGTYDVMLIASNYICPSDTIIKTVEVIDNVGIFEFGDQSFLVYPNPFENFINIAGFNATDKVDIKIYTIDGQLVLSDQFIPENSQISIINLQHLIPGNYLIEMNQNGKIYHLKVVK